MRSEMSRLTAKIKDISMSMGMMLTLKLPSRMKSIKVNNTLNARKKTRINKNLFIENGLVFMVGSYFFDFNA